MSKTYCLVFAGNPYTQVSVTECDAAGVPVTHQTYRAAKDAPDGSRVPDKRRGTMTVTDIFDPHSSAGAWLYHGTPPVIDAQPRSFADAIAVAERCPRGNHVDRMTQADAMLLVRDIVQSV